MAISVVVATVCLAVIAAMPTRESTEAERVPVSLTISPIETLPDATRIVEQMPELAPVTAKEKWVTLQIRNGDNMSTLFSRAGLTAQELHAIMSLGKEVTLLRKIKPGKKLSLETDETGAFKSLRYEETPLKNLIVNHELGVYEAYWEVVEPEILISYATATISESAPSLYHAGKAAGLSDNIIMKLSYIFQWDISFALDLRQGDSFVVMYEEVYVEGEKVKEGDIIAAEFHNMGDQYVAVLYDDGNGHKNYFAPDGRSMRKAFLRDPVHFSHISSNFNPNRLHPIHNRVMPHRGIDYAAPKGTPVLASGDGKVSIARQNNASGRYIVIQHGEQYTTKYLHLSGFANGIRAGKSVKQGEVIGYVGATGWATAPHLHYEFLVNGVHRNPRTVTLPQALPIPKMELARFKSTTQPLLTKLSSIVGNTSYAFAPKGADDGG